MSTKTCNISETVPDRTYQGYSIWRTNRNGRNALLQKKRFTESTRKKIEWR